MASMIFHGELLVITRLGTILFNRKQPLTFSHSLRDSWDGLVVLLAGHLRHVLPLHLFDRRLLGGVDEKPMKKHGRKLDVCHNHQSKKRHHHFIIISDMSLGIIIIIIIIIPKDCEEIFETCWNHQPLTFRLKQSHSIHRIHLEVHQKFHCSDPAQAPCQRKSAGRCGQWICPRLSAFADRTPHTARHNKQTPSYQ